MTQKTPNKKSAPPRVEVPRSKIEQHLDEQLKFLRKSAAEFDAGDRTEFRRLAICLRILLHNNPQRGAHSLVHQVGLEQSLFASCAMPTNPKNMLAEFNLAMVRMTDQYARLEPLLDRGPFPPRWIDFDAWITESVLRDDRRQHFSRNEIIRLVADQDGGAHVDPKIDEKYHRLISDNSIGVIQVDRNGEKPIEHIEKVYIRHIAYETLVSIELAWQKVLGNRLCDCGSSRKNRYCHGRPRR